MLQIYEQACPYHRSTAVYSRTRSTEAFTALIKLMLTRVSLAGGSIWAGIIGRKLIILISSVSVQSAKLSSATSCTDSISGIHDWLLWDLHTRSFDHLFNLQIDQSKKLSPNRHTWLIEEYLATKIIDCYSTSFSVTMHVNVTVKHILRHAHLNSAVVRLVNSVQVLTKVVAALDPIRASLHRAVNVHSILNWQTR